MGFQEMLDEMRLCDAELDRDMALERVKELEKIPLCSCDEPSIASMDYCTKCGRDVRCVEQALKGAE